MRMAPLEFVLQRFEKRNMVTALLSNPRRVHDAQERARQQRAKMRHQNNSQNEASGKFESCGTTGTTVLSLLNPVDCGVAGAATVLSTQSTQYSTTGQQEQEHSRSRSRTITKSRSRNRRHACASQRKGWTEKGEGCWRCSIRLREPGLHWQQQQQHRGGIKKCSACHRAWYCSKAWQVEDWSRHKPH